MNTEMLGKTAVEMSIAKCDLLESHINSNDKEPSWDGYVYIQVKEDKKEGVKRVPVQVKGKACDDIDKEEITYPVSLIDLDNFKRNGGVVYFVVYRHSDREQQKVYFASLPPFKVEQYLSEAKGKTTLSISLCVFPDSPDGKLAVFTTTYDQSQKQISFVNKELPTEEDLERQGRLDHLIFEAIPRDMKLRPFPDALFNSDIYMYAVTHEGSVPIPIKSMPQIDTWMTTENRIFSVGQKEYYNSHERVDTSNGIILRFWDGISFVLSRKQLSHASIRFEPKPGLRSRIHALEFQMDMAEHKELRTGDNTMNFSLNEGAIEKVQAQKGLLAFYHKIQSVLDILGVTDDMDVSNLSETDVGFLSMLFAAFLDKRAVRGIRQRLAPASTFNISNLSIIVAADYSAEEEGYVFSNLFDKDEDLYYLDRDGNKRDVSKYCQFNREMYQSLSNIDYDAILRSLKRVKNYEMANLALLEMIAAYDKKLNDRAFNATKELALWLKEDAPNDELELEIRLLNLLQVTKRERELNEEEVGSLYRIVESGNNREDILVGCYLLLNQQQAAELHFAKMDEILQEQFKQYPIYRFGKIRST